MIGRHIIIIGSDLEKPLQTKSISSLPANPIIRPWSPNLKRIPGNRFMGVAGDIGMIENSFLRRDILIILIRSSSRASLISITFNQSTTVASRWVVRKPQVHWFARIKTKIFEFLTSLARLSRQNSFDRWSNANSVIRQLLRQPTILSAVVFHFTSSNLLRFVAYFDYWHNDWI